MTTQNSKKPQVSPGPIEQRLRATPTQRSLSSTANWQVSRNMSKIAQTTAATAPKWQIFRERMVACPRTVLAAFELSSPPIDPFAIAVGLGIGLKAASLGDWYFAANGAPCISVATRDSVTRQRFSCASSIGSIVLGHNPGEFGVNQVLAHRFAVELLVPGHLLEACRIGAPGRDLAAVFNVSSHVIRVQADLLGLSI